MHIVSFSQRVSFLRSSFPNAADLSLQDVGQPSEDMATEAIR